jgi:hypothetical protein
MITVMQALITVTVIIVRIVQRVLGFGLKHVFVHIYVGRDFRNHRMEALERHQKASTLSSLTMSHRAVIVMQVAGGAHGSRSVSHPFRALIGTAACKNGRPCIEPPILHAELSHRRMTHRVIQQGARQSPHSAVSASSSVSFLDWEVDNGLHPGDLHVNYLSTASLTGSCISGSSSLDFYLYF